MHVLSEESFPNEKRCPSHLLVLLTAAHAGWCCEYERRTHWTQNCTYMASAHGPSLQARLCQPSFIIRLTEGLVESI